MNQGRREDSEVSGEKGKKRPLRAKRAENFHGREISFGQLLLAYFMKLPDFEALGVVRPLGALGLGAICSLLLGGPGQYHCGVAII